MLRKVFAVLTVMMMLAAFPAGSVLAGEDAAEEDAPGGAIIGYVLVSGDTEYGWLPVPETGGYSYTLEQVFDDDTRTVNVIHVSSEGVYMESSTCENQDCVEEGIVTFENLNTRILGWYIICLPNGVTLALYSVEEVAAMLAAEEERE